jgi:hypothetical protein
MSFMIMGVVGGERKDLEIFPVLEREWAEVNRNPVEVLLNSEVTLDNSNPLSISESWKKGFWKVSPSKKW